MSNVRQAVFDNEQTLSVIGKKLGEIKLASGMESSEEKSHSDCGDNNSINDDTCGNGINIQELRCSNNCTIVHTVERGSVFVQPGSSGVLDINCGASDIGIENCTSRNINCSSDLQERYSNNFSVMNNDSPSRIDRRDLVFRRRTSEVRRREKARYGRDGHVEIKRGRIGETDNLLTFADKLRNLICDIPEKGRRISPYSTRKISNMWRSFIPPTMETLCREVSMDGWSAVSHKLLQVTVKTLAELRNAMQTDIPGNNVFLERIEDMGLLRITLSQTHLLEKMRNVKYVVFWECYLSGFFKSWYTLASFIILIY